MNRIPRLRDYRRPVLLSYGFRPFFLFGAVYAGLAVLAWLPIFNGELVLWSAFSAVDWHVHEMLYGYVAAGGRFSAYGDPQLDRTAADPGHALARTSLGMAGGPRLRHFFR
jgi:hypothetical protein